MGSSKESMVSRNSGAWRCNFARGSKREARAETTRSTARILPFFAVALGTLSLSACGGSDGESSVSRVQTFQDRSGTAIGTVEIGGKEYVLVGFSSSASDFDDIADGRPRDTPPIELGDLVYSSSNSYGDFYTFSVVFEGVTYEGVAYQETTDKSILLFGGDGAGYAFTLAQGDRLTDLPTSRVATYAGTNIISSRDGLFGEVGTFSLVADFANGRVALDGSTPNSRITADAVPIDKDKGTFAAVIGTLTVNGVSEPASIVGAFTGDSAFGVSGIYLDNDSDRSGPEYVGAFDG